MKRLALVLAFAGLVVSASAEVPATDSPVLPRVAQGYMPAEEFVSFVRGEKSGSDGDLWTRTGGSVILILLFAFLGGLAMNLTPCVLPMVPINLMVIGRSAMRGAAYGLGIALAYGALGVAAAVGGLAFGEIQGSAWFNLAVAVVFVVLALALLDVFFLDFSRFRSRFQKSGAPEARGVAFAFSMGALAAVLAGACVAPILVSVLLLTADLFAKGRWIALGLPFVLGLGMALPWPFAGAGLKVLPKPGGWMKNVNRLFALIVFGFAAWYGHLAWRGFFSSDARPTATPETFAETLAKAKRPVLVDCWASWCKNCSAMDAVLEKPEVRKALRDHTVIRLQAEDMSELVSLPGFETVKGLPAFVIFD